MILRVTLDNQVLLQLKVEGKVSAYGPDQRLLGRATAPEEPEVHDAEIVHDEEEQDDRGGRWRSTATVKAVLDRKKRGEDYRTIAKGLGISRSMVWKILHKHGAVTKLPRHVTNPRMIKAVHELRAQGVTLDAIAQQLSMSTATVWKILKLPKPTPRALKERTELINRVRSNFADDDPFENLGRRR